MEQWEIEQKYQGLIYDFYYEKLKFCGCGRPDFTLGFIKNLLNVIQKKTDEYNKSNYNHEESYNNHQGNLRDVFEFRENEDYWFTENQDGIIQFVLYYLGEIGVLEHGGGIGGAWLSTYGKEILEALNYFDDLEDVL